MTARRWRLNEQRRESFLHHLHMGTHRAHVGKGVQLMKHLPMGFLIGIAAFAGTLAIIYIFGSGVH